MIHICFNLDEKYIYPCKVLIKGILANTQEKVTFHFIGISERDMETNSHCVFYPKPDLSYFNDENLTDYYYFSQAAMYRLLIPFLINTDKALYMDIDMLVLKDIKELWDTEVEYVGAVIDPCNIFRNKRLKTGAENYYNSGLILFNSKAIREKMTDYKELILKAQKDYILDLKDQDIFNIVFKNNIKTIDYKWNIDANNLKEKTEPKNTSKQKDEAYADPSIVHIMGKNKWWMWEGLPFGEYWDTYAGNDIPHRKKCIRVNGLTIMRN